MAKKKKNDNNDIDIAVTQEEKSGNKILSILIVLVIVIIWLAVFAALIKLDIGGFGSRILRPVLKDIPVISKILPEATDEELITDNNYSFKNIAEAVARIQELEGQISQATGSNTALSDHIAQLEAENARLKVFEDNQAAFEQRVADFDSRVVFGENAPSVDEYITFYEGINPENAAELYRQAVEQKQYDTKVINHAKRISSMDAAKAAAVLEVMTGDIDLVVAILENMSTAKSALILENMTSEMAAQLTARISSKD